MAFTPTAIAGAGADRFGVKGNTEFVWVPTVANAGLVPTEVEINAGSNLTCAIAALNGFTVSEQYSDLPDLCSDVTGRVRDGATLADSSINFYLSSTIADTDAFDFFDTGDTGVLYHCPWGLEGSNPAVAWAMTVGSVLPPLNMTGGSLVTVNMSPTQVEKITLPVET